MPLHHCVSVVLNEKESVDTSRNLSIPKQNALYQSEDESPTIPKRRTKGSSMIKKEMSQNCLWVHAEIISLG